MNLHALMEGNDSAQYRHLLLMKAINTIFWLGNIVKGGQLGDHNEGAEISEEGLDV
jgi:hypothetical protein